MLAARRSGPVVVKGGSLGTLGQRGASAAKLRKIKPVDGRGGKGGKSRYRGMGGKMKINA